MSARGSIYKSFLTIAAPVYPDEKQAVEDTAAACGMSVAQWLRLVALERAGDDRVVNLLAAAVRFDRAFDLEQHTAETDVAREQLDEAAFVFSESLTERDRQTMLRRAVAPASQAPDFELPSEPLPAVCVDEVWLPIEVMREIRDCLAERTRWFESRGRAVPPATREAAHQVARAIEYAAGHSDPVSVAPRDTTLARAAVRHADAIEQAEPACGPDRHEQIMATDEELHEAVLAFARSLSAADRERLGR